jgi:AcrR family transcriptional regulator
MTPTKRTPESRERLRVSLVGHARRLVEREGASALTMRALAAEAECAVGLPYKVFAGRDELVLQLLRDEFQRLRAELDQWAGRAGTGTIAENLAAYPGIFLDSPALALAHEVEHAPHTTDAVDAAAAETGVVAALEGAVERYLVGEKERGRVAGDVDEKAFAFLIAGAVHNLLISGDLYPRPTSQEMDRYLGAVADRLRATGGPACHG